MPHKDQPPLTDRERRAAERRGALLDAPSGEWIYAGRTIPAWLAAITANGRLRPDAARAAHDHMGSEAYPHVRTLVAALDNWRTYNFACVALGCIGPRALEAVTTLVARMRTPPQHDASSPARSKEDVARLFAAVAVAKIGAELANLPALVDALSDSYMAVGRNAAEALGGLGGAAAPAVPALVEALDDVQLRLWAARAIGSIGHTARPAGPALAALAARNEWHHLTAAAVEAIGRIGYAEGRDTVRAVLHDRYADVRKAAAKALEHLGT
jgi:HEAT repeat protein